MKDTLAQIVKAIVEKKDKVKISESQEGELTIFNISVDKDDMGKVIGKNGKIIRAIRNVMKIPAIKQDKHINILLEETPA